MDTLIERHPLAFLGIAMVLACLLATVHVARGSHMKRTYTQSENVIFDCDVIADEQRVQIEIPLLDARLAIRFVQFRRREHGAKMIGLVDIIRHSTPWTLRVKFRGGIRCKKNGFNYLKRLS